MLLALCSNIEAVKKCCQGKNIMLDEVNCQDGSSVTVLDCETRILIGPTLYPPMILEVDNKGNLTIIDEEAGGYRFVNFDRFVLLTALKN